MNGILALVGIIYGTVGFILGFRIAKEHNSVVYDDLKCAKEMLKDIINRFVIPLKKFSFTDNDEYHIDKAIKFINYLEKNYND